jgi:hypothetical protein
MLLGWYIMCEVPITTMLEVAAVLFYYRAGQKHGLREPEFGRHNLSRSYEFKKISFFFFLIL